MAKTAQKKVANAAETEGNSPTTVEVELKSVARPTVVENHQVVRRWREEKTLDEVEEDEFDDDDGNEGGDDVDIAADDPIAKVLSEIAGSRSTWSVSVSRLPNYDKDNRTDPKSRRFAGSLSIPDAEYLKEERYLEDLQQKFARGQNGNWFLMCVRRDNRNFAYLPPVCVEPPAPEMIAAKAIENGNTPINIFNPQQNPGDLMDAMLKQFEKFNKLQTAMMPPWMKDMQFPAAAPVASTGNDQLTDEKALLHILNREGDIVDAVVSKLKGLMKGNSAVEEKSWADVAVAALTSPTLPTVISQLVAQLRAPMANPSEPPQPHFQQQQLPPDVAAYQIVIRRLTDSLKINGEVESVIAAIDGFLTLFPQHQSSVEGLINLPPEQALQMLAQVEPSAAEVVAMPHAVEWIQRLRDAYFQPGENTDGVNQ